MIRKVSALIIFIFFIFAAKIFSQSKCEVGKVVRVIDGDTFQLEDGRTVRLLGIDAPEKNEYYYIEARERLAELIEGKKVCLEKYGKNKDRYGRLLRYIFLNDQFINLKLVEEGYARVDGPGKYMEKLAKAENMARNRKIGIWNIIS